MRKLAALALALTLIAAPLCLHAQGSLPDPKTLGQPPAQSKLDKKSKKKNKKAAEADPDHAPIDTSPMPDMSLHEAILTVDGLVAKAGLNYEVRSARFFYFSIPGVGTAIVSDSKFPNAASQADAFHGDTLTFDVAGHTVELTNDKPILHKGTDMAWVALDNQFVHQKRYPEMGYGDAEAAPYNWPGALARTPTTQGAVAPPPLPAGVAPRREVESSYTATDPPRKN